MRTTHLALAGLLAAAALPAHAGSFTTVDISSVVNGHVDRNPDTFPLGTTTGNLGTGIPFQISPNNGVAGTFIASGGTGDTATLNVNIPGQASFYALLNNYYGTPGADEYDITVGTLSGNSITYKSIGGVDTRDYNKNLFTNTIANTTKPWFDNGIGQRLDLREFNLPVAFAADVITSFTVTQVNPQDYALFSGLTFSDIAIPAPEPAALALMGLGVAGLTVARRRSR